MALRRVTCTFRHVTHPTRFTQQKRFVTLAQISGVDIPKIFPIFAT